ncbi:MAG: SMC-Scp complex subunit ScpB [Lachnospiraceae bacterium]|nr:SMC-Scp complex subunit ScpB [Lachnospiraceae bacterium]
MTDALKKVRGALEAVLFTMGQAVSMDTLKMALDCDEETVKAALDELKELYEDEGRGLRILQLEDAYQLCTKPDYYDALVKIATQPIKPILSEVMLEVLSIIAYRQPVTRNEIEKIRGVSSDYTVSRLVEFGLVEEAGRLDAPGRPILFKTTEEFLRKFGLSSVRELPAFDDLTKDAIEEVYRHTGFNMEGQLSLDLEV